MDKIIELLERTLSPTLKPVWESVVFGRDDQKLNFGVG
jgi:hypothetical protein